MGEGIGTWKGTTSQKIPSVRFQCLWLVTSQDSWVFSALSLLWMQKLFWLLQLVFSPVPACTFGWRHCPCLHVRYKKNCYLQVVQPGSSPALSKVGVTSAWICHREKGELEEEDQLGVQHAPTGTGDNEHASWGVQQFEQHCSHCLWEPLNSGESLKKSHFWSWCETCLLLV